MWDLKSHRKSIQKIVPSTHFLIFLVFFVSIFGDGACSPSLSCPSETKNEEQLPRPRLKLLNKDGTLPILEEPGDQIVQVTGIQNEITSEATVYEGGVSCTAPYPVLLVALMADDNEEEFKMSGLSQPNLEEFNVYPSSKPWNNYPAALAQRNTSVFETRSILFLSTERNVSVFACEAVDNPCLTSAGKLVFTNLGKSRQSGWRPFFNFTIRMTQNLQQHRHPFFTSGDTSLPQTKTKSDSSANSSLTGTKMESDCDAIFYYQMVETAVSDLALRKKELAYSCEFSDGSPGIVKAHRCAQRGRCNFPRKSKQAKQNCWRQFLPGTTCKNCTKTKLLSSLMEHFVPLCVGSPGVSSLGPEQVSSTEQVRENERAQAYRKSYIMKEDMADGIRVVKGTPLYVGFPSGFNISRPTIRTTEDEEGGGNERMIRMHVFEEVQLVNSSLEITCDSSGYYSPKGFAWALKFHNKTQLEFLQAPNETEPLRMIRIQGGLAYTQTINYHLDERDLDVERIFCFAPVQNSHNWINASRPLRVVPHVQDLFKPSSSSCQFPAVSSSLQLELESHPQLVIKPRDYANRQEFFIPAEHETEYPFDKEKNYVECEANYPVELIHDSATSVPRKEFSSGGNFQYSRQNLILQEGQYTMHYNFAVLDFDIATANYSHFFRCQSIENPCLHRSFQFLRLPGSVQNPNSQNQNFMIRNFPPGNSSQPQTVKTELGRPPQYEECEVLFFYKETSDQKGYEFRCEFAMEQTGTVNFHYCDSMNGCANTLRNRRQSTKCWRKVESWENCRFNCGMTRPDGFRPFVATCTIDQQYYEIGRWQGFGPRYRESTLGNFAVFGLATRPDETPPIYFSQEEIDPRKMTHLEPFEPFQFPGTTLNFTCSVSAFFNRPDIGHSQIAKYFASRHELQLVQGKRRSVLNKRGNYWSFTENIELGNDTELSHIYCIGLDWKGSNSSREIHLHAPETPKVALLVNENEEERVIVERGEKAYADQEEDKVLLPLAAYNVSLICHGFGYPPPEISWTTTAANVPRSEWVVVNITHSLSRVFLPIVDVGFEGTYTCTTRNKLGRVSSHTRVGVEYPLSYSLWPIFDFLGQFLGSTLNQTDSLTDFPTS